MADKKTTPKKSENKDEKLVYIGPTLSKGRLPYATIYYNGLPEHIQEIIKANPWFRQLFVPIEKMEKAIASTHKKGDVLHTLYQRAIKEV